MRSSRPWRAPAAWRVLRAKHWIKNAFVVAPLVFAQRFEDGRDVARTGLAVVAFCLLSSAVYVFNDVADRESDRLDPRKRERPVASGELRPAAGAALALALAVSGLGLGAALGAAFLGVGAAYLALNLAYSFRLKHVVVLDVMIVAAGFLLRAWAGAIAIDVGISHWLILCTGLVALFLGFVKRRQELVAAAGGPPPRRALEGYSIAFLDQAISVVTGATIVAYALYAFSPEVAAKHGTDLLGLTLPFVVFGIFRYLYLVYQRNEGDNPTTLVLGDAPLRWTIALWAAVAVVLLAVGA